MRAGLVATMALAASVFPSLALGQEVIVLSGQTVSLGPVYWVSNCQSTLRRVADVTVLSGSPSIQLSLKRNQMVRATKQGCPNPVPGAHVMVTAKNVTQEERINLQYVVTYETTTGTANSRHNRTVVLLPRGR